MLLFVLPLVSNCMKETNERIAVEPGTSKITWILKNNRSKGLVNELELWKFFWNNINWAKAPEQFTYQNGNLKSIAFHLKNSNENVRFNPLVVSFKDRKFMAVITKGEKVGSQQNKISYFKTKNAPYLSFLIDNKQKISNYKIV